MRSRTSPLPAFVAVAALAALATGPALFSGVAGADEEPSALPDAAAPKAPVTKAPEKAPETKNSETKSPTGKAPSIAGQGEKSSVPRPPVVKGAGGGRQPVRAALEVRVLTAGRAPYAWRVPGRVAGSFVTDAPDALSVAAEAHASGQPELDREIRWEIDPPAGFELPVGAQLTGPRLSVRLRRAGGNPSGMGAPLSFTVRAAVAQADQKAESVVTLQQDLRDRLRQEYVDLQRADVPARGDLLDEAEFMRRYGKRFPRVHFGALNWSRQPGSEERYPVILAEPRLVQLLDRLEKLYGSPVQVSSGFRNPVRQVEVHAGVDESHHQYGRAADLYVMPDSAAPRNGRKVASEGDWLRLAAASLRAGGAWVEPMTDCHVGTDGCHVHVDVRGGGAQSRLVQVAGEVRDAAGNPVQNAMVRLAGMPAVTNAGGQFSLKHVLVPREYELQVDAGPRGEATQPVTVGDVQTKVSVRVSPQPQPTLDARVDGVKRWKEIAAVRLLVRNSGFGPASDVRLEATAPASDVKVTSLQPEAGTALQPGAESEWVLRLSASPTMTDSALLALPFRLTARFKTAGGQERTQPLELKSAPGAGPVPQLFSPPVANPAPEPPAPMPASTPAAVRRNPQPITASEGGALLVGLVLGGVLGAFTALIRRGSRPRTTPHTPSDTTSAPATQPAAEAALIRLEKESPAAH